MVCYLQHARSKLQRHSLASGEHVGDVPLPGLGSVREFSGRRKDSEAFFTYTDFTVPAAIYRSAALVGPHSGGCGAQKLFWRTFR